MQFSLFFEEIEIGHTLLEHGDPPMGVVHGEFIANESYNHVKGLFLSETRDKNVSYPLQIKLSDGSLLPTSFVGLVDYSDQTGHAQDVDIELTMQSSDYYKQYFAHHIEAYERQFI